MSNSILSSVTPLRKYDLVSESNALLSFIRRRLKRCFYKEENIFTQELYPKNDNAFKTFKSSRI